MAFRSIALTEKPLPHLSLSDWNARLNQLRNVADARRNDASKIRYSAHTLRNETRIDSEWTSKETNEAIQDRIVELQRWREVINTTYQRILIEMRLLEEETTSTTRELDALQQPISVIAECLTMRDCRLGSELTYDEADTEIKNELAVAENNQRLLTEQCHRAWEKLCRLEDVKFKIGLEIDNKAEAEELDTLQLELNRLSSNITYKPDATRRPRNSCTYKTWLDHVKSMKQLAENELADTYSIRESLFVSREKARNMLQSQQDRAEHCIRKRIFETQRARNELEYQQMKIKDEMQAAICEIKRLEQSLCDKIDNLKLAETRLENRAQRSGMELCRDDAYNALIREVKQLRNIRQSIKDKIDESKKNYNLLEDHARKIDVDLENKQHSLMTDIRALDLRTRLRGGEFSKNPPPTGDAQTDRNIQLTHMEDELPRN